MSIIELLGQSMYISMSLSLCSISITTRLQLGVLRQGIDGDEDPSADDP